MRRKFPYTLEELHIKAQSEDGSHIDGGYIRSKYGDPMKWTIDDIQEIFAEYEYLFGKPFEGKSDKIQMNDQTLWQAFLAYRKMLAIR